MYLASEGVAPVDNTCTQSVDEPTREEGWNVSSTGCRDYFRGITFPSMDKDLYFLDRI